MFINIFGMKGKLITSLTVLSLFMPGAGADQFVIDSPSGMASVPMGADLLINNGGVYNLSALDGIGAGSINVNFDSGGSNSIIIFNADSGFDGVLDASLKTDNFVKIRLDDYVAQNTDDVVLRFTHFDASGAAGLLHPYVENDSRMYSYSFEPCATGYCVVRRLSNSYTETQNNARQAVHVAQVSVQNNPVKLLYPVVMINSHELFSVYDFGDDTHFSVSPEYYHAKGMHNVGARINVGTQVGGKLSVGLSGYAATGEFKNDVSGFNVNVYGGNLRLHYQLDEVLFLRGVGGITIANIDCDNVADGAEHVDNPDAFSVYGGADFGAVFNFESGLYMSPFVGYAMNSARVVDVHENDNFAHMGNDIGYKYFMDGVSYNYSLRTGINSNGYFDAGVGIGIMSVNDKIGGTVSFGIMDSDFGWSTKVSANIRFVF